MLNNVKKNLVKIIISSIVILLPMIFGLIIYPDLPEQIALHWNMLGEIDGYGSANFIVFAFPVIMLTIHIALIPVSFLLDGKKEQPDKIMNLSLSIIPIISVFISVLLYATAFGLKFNAMSIISALFAVLFILIGNYLPKARQNKTFGIKISWTLANEENWNATHRFSGKIWVIGGVISLFAMFLPMIASAITMGVIFLIITVAPIVYSYVYYKRDVKEGRATEEDYKYKMEKRPLALTIAILGIVAAFILVIMFVGEMNVTYGDTAFTIDSSFTSAISVDYADIDSIELRNDISYGAKMMGFNSPTLHVGTFQNEEFGAYTLYTYTATPIHVVITIDEKILVIGGVDDAASVAIYNAISERIPE